jgi:2-phospho-L-lactate guanylyltransferase
MSIALVPIKRLSAGKSRLHPKLARKQLEALSVAMLEDIVEALREAPSVSRVVVVTPDETVVATADAAGAEGLLLAVPGLNPSLEAATARFAGEGEASLIVLGDVAGARAKDIEALHVALAAQAGGVALAPSTDGGTSALLRDPPNAIACHFGPDSAKAHREATQAAGLAFCELPLPSLAIDLDQAADLERFLATESGGQRTRALLRQWSEEDA